MKPIPFLSFSAALIFVASCGGKKEPEIELSAGQGILVGEVTATSANVQVRLTVGTELIDRDLAGAAGNVVFELIESGSEGPATIQTARTSSDYDFIGRTTFNKLKPGTEYTCYSSIFPEWDQDDAVPKIALHRDGPTATFRTLPGAESDTETSFVVVTGMNYAKFHGDDRIDRAQHLVENNMDLPKPYDGPDKALGYPALESILKLKPHFFVGTGDNVYYDTPDNPRAESIPELRQKWHEQFVQPRYRDLFAAVPTYWMVDDHDYRIDDGDNSGEYDPTPEVARKLMLEQLPIAPQNDVGAKTYRTHRVNKNLQVWFPENRMYRSHNESPDGPEKTIWGAEQKDWLMKTLGQSDATFKLLISPTPMVGPDDLRKTDNHTNHGGFRHERDEFFGWLKETELNQNHFYIVCGDRHWQYHAIDPSGIEEFSSGALVDANSRLGRAPGDPASTDPEGLIKQPYSQNPRSGGFLHISVKPDRGEGRPSTLVFTWHDEKGAVLYTTTKSGPVASL